ASGDSSINALNHYGFAPLHLAAFLNNPKALETLLAAGAYVDIIGGTEIVIGSNMTPLMTAIQRDAASAAYVLIRHHAQINAVDSNGLTPLHYAVFSKNPELTNALINHKAHLDVRSYDLGMTPLHYAIPFLEGDDITNATEVVFSLVQAGADVNVLDRFRLTALDMAKDFAEGHPEMVEIVDILERSGAKTGKEILEAAEAHNQAVQTS
ncbi:ankyrin repeat domain-containing protein, partial [bacterium]|nr:ankyrin repeat domain-containing protein [bacterium]